MLAVIVRSRGNIWYRSIPMVVNKIFFLNALRPRQYGRHFADDIFKDISLNENLQGLTTTALKCIPYDLISSMAALFQIMAWHRTYTICNQSDMTRLEILMCMRSFVRQYIFASWRMAVVGWLGWWWMFITYKTYETYVVCYACVYQGVLYYGRWAPQMCSKICFFSRAEQ